MTGGDRLLPVDVRRTAGCGSSRLAATENSNNVFGSKDVTRVCVVRVLWKLPRCPVSPHLCFLLCASCPLNAPFAFWNHSFEGGCTAAFHSLVRVTVRRGMKFSIRSTVLPDRVHCGRSSVTRTLCYWPTFRFFFSCRASHISSSVGVTL